MESFKDLYNYRDEKNEKEHLKKESDYNDSLTNDFIKKSYLERIIFPCFKKIEEENKKFSWKALSINEIYHDFLVHKFIIKLDEDEYDQCEKYTTTIFLNEFLNVESAEIKIIIDGYNSDLRVESIDNYSKHTSYDLEIEILNLFKEMKDREDRLNSK